MRFVPLKLRGRVVGPQKAIVAPELGARNVLTNSPWTFTGLWLKRNHKDKALFYWEQAQEFHAAAQGLPLRSAPLLLYYAYMNATKALLAAKNVNFNEYHGVRAHPPVVSGAKRAFSADGVRIMQAGVLPSLSQYYGEAETANTHTLQELFFNMVFIHRTYCLTYTSQREMFLPLANCTFMTDRRDKHVFFVADVPADVSLSKAIRSLPKSFAAAPEIGARAIRSAAFMTWQKPGKPSGANIRALVQFNRELRAELQYINGAQTLWYLKLPVSGPARLRRQLPTLILAGMHRLSEICRYQPLQLASLLDGQKNWLLSEFIRMSDVQFIDEIASEVTGNQFLIPNVRAPY